jgi:D-alanyl-D-alanine carboxypeptidase
MRRTFYTNLTLLIFVAVVCAGMDSRGQETAADGKATPRPSVLTPQPDSDPILLQPGRDGKPAPGSGQPGMHLPGPGGFPPSLPEAKAIPQPKNDQDLAAAIKKLADTLASSGRFSGSILVALDGKPLVDGAWGEADREQRIANTPETAYDIGSIGKLFTQIAILQLLEKGKLSLDDTFGKYLTNYPDPDIADKVTIRQLLLHASGLGDIFDQSGSENLGNITELKGFLPLFAHKPLAFEPSSKTLYSNAGYIVLGMVIEAVSGENYYSYIKAHILQPAGMSRSGFFDRKHLPASVAHSYEDGEDVTGAQPERGSPAGGLQAPVSDLLRLVQTINAGKLVSKDSVKLLRDMIPRLPNAPAPPDNTKLIAYGIGGGAPGVSAGLSIDPTGRYTRVVLCNASPPMAMSMGASISEWIKQMPK